MRAANESYALEMNIIVIFSTKRIAKIVHRYVYCKRYNFPASQPNDHFKVQNPSFQNAKDLKPILLGSSFDCSYLKLCDGIWMFMH